LRHEAYSKSSNKKGKGGTPRPRELLSEVVVYSRIYNIIDIL